MEATINELTKSDFFYQLFERIRWRPMEANLTKAKNTITFYIGLNSYLLKLFLLRIMFLLEMQKREFP